MVTQGQARERIWDSITRAGGAATVSARTRPTPGEPPAVSTSMLYKFRGGSSLGRESVNALSPILCDIDAETWLAAMGVETVEPQDAHP